jgi:hypothetical protein
MININISSVYIYRKMKFLASTFEEYISAIKKYNLHPELQPIMESAATNSATSAPPPNMIFYGPAGVGKYSQMLWFLKPRFQKKLTVQYNKQSYNFHFSNIHYEIDMALLGCNSKLLWHDIFVQIIDIITVRALGYGVIVCKNFHAIHTELLEIFYSYMMGGGNSITPRVSFILLTEHISFIPTNIINSCFIVNVARPSVTTYAALYEATVSSPSSQPSPSQPSPFPPNLKEYLAGGAGGGTRAFQLICDNIIKQIKKPETLSFIEFRDAVYEIFIYNLDVAECIWYIIVHVSPPTLPILQKSYSFLKYYNNNYRPIYHLENFLLFLSHHTMGRSPPLS